MKVLLRIFGVLLGTVLLISLGLEIYFNFYFDHDDLRDRVNELLDKSINETVTLSDFNLTIYDRFMHVSVSVEDLLVHDDTDTLVVAGLAVADVHLINILDKDFEIEKVTINDALFKSHVHLDTLKSEISFVKGQNGGSGGISLTSHDVEINNSRVWVVNDLKGQDTRISVEKAELNLTGSDNVISITGEAYGRIDSVFSSGNLVLADRSVSAVNALVEFDTEKKGIYFKEGNLNISSARFSLRGSIVKSGPGNQIDLNLLGTDTELNTILAFIPPDVKHEIVQINEEASITLEIVKEGFSNRYRKPRTDVRFSIVEAALKNGESELVLDGMNIIGFYTNGEKRNSETSRIDIYKADAKLGESFFASHFSIDNFDDPHIDSSIKGRMNINNLKHFFALSEEINEMRGFVDVDLKMEGKLSDLAKGDVLQERYHGNIIFDDLNFDMSDSHFKIENVSGHVEVDNDKIILDGIEGRFNNVRFTLGGNLNQYAGLFLDIPEHNLEAYLDLYLHKHKIDSASGRGGFEFPDIPEFITTEIDIRMDSLEWSDNVFTNMATKVTYFDKNIHVKDFEARVWNGLIFADAFLNHGEGYLKGRMNLSADLDRLDISYINFGGLKKKRKEDANQIDVNVAVSIDSLKYGTNSFHLDRLTGRIEKGNYVFDRMNLFNDNVNVRIRRPISISPSDKTVKGSLSAYLKNVDLQKYLSQEDTTSGPLESTIFEWYRDSELDITIDTDKITYGGNYFDDNKIDLSLRNGISRVSFDTKVYDGRLSGSINSSISDSVWFGHVTLDAHDIHLKTFLLENDNFSQKLLNDQHVNGSITFNSNFNTVFDLHTDEWLAVSGWTEIDSLDLELIDFYPVTHALRFIKYDYLDTLDVVARDLRMYFSEYEIVVPPVVLKTSESNFLLFGYHDKEDYIEMDIEVSLSDLIFKSRKKRYSDFNNAEMNDMGGLDFRLSLSGRSDSLDAKHIRKRIFRNRLEDIKIREQELRDEIIRLRMSAFGPVISALD